MASHRTKAKSRLRSLANTFGHAWMWPTPFPDDWKTNPEAIKEYWRSPYLFEYSEDGVKPAHVPDDAEYKGIGRKKMVPVNEFYLTREVLEFWRNDLSLHGVGDIDIAQEIDALLAQTEER